MSQFNTSTWSSGNYKFCGYIIYSLETTPTSRTITITSVGVNQTTSLPAQWGSGAGNVTVTVDGSTAYNVNNSTITWSGSGNKSFSTTDKKYTFTRGTSAQSVKIKVSASKTYQFAGSVSSTLTISIPALDSYKIQYNGNGATSGSMSYQTKYYGRPIGLHSNSYSRTGYNFSKFNTAKNGTGTNYNSGGTYSANSSATLYAQWTAKSYTLKYGANGGTVSPTSKTVKYDAPYGTLPTPTRTNYSFAGWYTAASGGSAVSANTICKGDAQIYAHWTLVAVAPIISNLKVVRVNSDGEVAGDGTRIKVTFKFTKGKNGSSYEATNVTIKINNNTLVNTSLSNNTGSYTYTTSSGTTYSIDNSHTVVVTLQATYSASQSVKVPPMIYPIDLYSDDNDNVYMGIMHPYVSGKLLTTSAINVDGTASISSTLTTGGKLTISNTTNNSGMQVYGVTTTNSTLTTGGKLTVNAGGLQVVDGNLTVSSGTASISSNLTVGGTATINNNTTIDGYVRPQSTGTNSLGTSDYRWMNLWLTGNITMGGTLSSSSNSTAAITTDGRFRVNDWVFIGRGYSNSQYTTDHGMYSLKHSKWIVKMNSDQVVVAEQVGAKTNSNGANTYVTTGGGLYRSTASSQRYKTDIKTIESSELNPQQLYYLPIRQFKYKTNYIDEYDSRADYNIPGFIVEEIERIYNIAVDYDDDGNPEDWNARYLIPPMLELIQEQHQEIEQLKKEIMEIKTSL